MLGTVLPAANARRFTASSIVAEVHDSGAIFDPGQIAREVEGKLGMSGSGGVVVIGGDAPLVGFAWLLVPFLGDAADSVIGVADAAAGGIDPTFDVVAVGVGEAPDPGIGIFDAGAA